MSMSEEKEFVRAVRELKKLKRQAAMEKVFRVFGKVLPRGYKDPSYLYGSKARRRQ